MKIIVSNLSTEATVEDLTVLFSNHGLVSSVKFAVSPADGTPRGMAVVEMASRPEGEKALASLRYTKLKGQSLLLQEMHNNSSVGNNNTNSNNNSSNNGSASFR